MASIAIAGIDWCWEHPDGLRNAVSPAGVENEDEELDKIADAVITTLKLSPRTAAEEQDQEHDQGNLDDTKCAVLCGLVEVADLLLSDRNRRERTLAALLSIDNKLNPRDTEFARQLMITITEILIEFKYYDQEFDQLSGWLSTLLLRISKTNNLLILQRRTACQCLHELELSYPGLLARKLDKIASVCSEEKSHASDCYIMLLSTILRQSVVLLTEPQESKDSRIPSRVLSEATMPTNLNLLVNGEGETLHPYYPSAIMRTKPVAMQYNQTADECGTVEMEGIKKYLSLIVNSLGTANPPVVLFTVCAMASCVKLLGVRPQVFSPIFPNFISSSNLMTLQSLVTLEAYFPGTILFTDAENSYFWSRLLTNLNHGSLTEEHHLLHLAWLSEWLRQIKVLSEFDALEQCAQLLPRIFDSPEIMYRKVSMVAGLFCRVPTDQQTGDSDLELVYFDKPRSIMKLLLCFSDYSYMKPTALQVAALFRTLYTLYIFESDQSRVFRKEIYNFVLKAVMKNPKFINVALDLGKSIYKLMPDQAIHNDLPFLFALLEELQSTMLSNTDTEIMLYFRHYLVLLKSLASESGINPSTYMARLHEFLRSSSFCTDGKWEQGMEILEVCRVLMLSQPTKTIIKPLGDLLSLLWTSYEDIDVRDHARFFYILLTNISGEQLRDVLRNRTESVESINDIMTDNLKLSSSCELAKPVQSVDNPGVSILRNIADQVHDIEGVDIIPAADINLDLKQTFLDTLQVILDEASVEIEYKLKYASNVQSVDAMFAIVITFAENNRVQPIVPVEIPILERSGPDDAIDEVLFSLKLRTRDPVPMSLQASIEYSDSGGDAFTGVLPNIDLGFWDLMIQVPWSSYLTETIDIHTVFRSIWSGISQGSTSSDVEKLESVLMLTVVNIVNSEDTLIRRLLKVLGRFAAKVYRLPEDKFHVLVGAFFLPQHIILLEMEVTVKTVAVKIVTNNAKALPFVEKSLRSIVNLTA